MARRSEHHFQQAENPEVIMAVRWSDGTIRSFQGYAEVDLKPEEIGERRSLFLDPYSADSDRKMRAEILFDPGMIARHHPGVERWNWRAAQPPEQINDAPKEIEP